MFRSPLVVGVPTVCSDGKFRPRFPDGIWTPPGAQLSGGAAASPHSSGALSTGSSAAVPIFFSDFSGYTLPGSWQFGSQAGGAIALSNDTSANFNGADRNIKGAYPAAMGGQGAVFVWGVQYPADYAGWVASKNHVYVRVRAKMPGPKWGSKFIKIFGGSNGNGSISNCTFGLDYTGADPGGQLCVSFGDGTDLLNDTQNCIYHDGNDPDQVGRSLGTAVITHPKGRAFRSIDWGTDWHLFEFAVGFNSGTTAANEKADGWFFVRIDGEIYTEARNIFNRHYASPPIERVELFGQSQGANPSAFELWYARVEITQDAFGALA